MGVTGLYKFEQQNASNSSYYCDFLANIDVIKQSSGTVGAHPALFGCLFLSKIAEQGFKVIDTTGSMVPISVTTAPVTPI